VDTVSSIMIMTSTNDAMHYVFAEFEMEIEMTERGNLLNQKTLDTLFSPDLKNREEAIDHCLET
jgi:hypothetical protein